MFKVNSKLSKSFFHKDNFFVIIGLIVGVLSIPIMISSIYQPQIYVSQARVVEDGGGSGGYVFSKPTSAPVSTSGNNVNANTNAKNEVDNGLPENECDVDADCGSGYICRRSGGARRCIEKEKPTVTVKPTSTPKVTPATSGGGGKPYAYQAPDQCYSDSDCKEGFCVTNTHPYYCSYTNVPTCDLGSKPIVNDTNSYCVNGKKTVVIQVCEKWGNYNVGHWVDRILKEYDCSENNYQINDDAGPQCYNSSNRKTYFPCGEGAVCFNNDTCVEKKEASKNDKTLRMENVCDGDKERSNGIMHLACLWWKLAKTL